MKILVTGAAGFIGEALVAALAQRADVESVLALDQSPLQLEHPKVVARVGDITDAQLVRSVLDERIGAVYHLAALVSGAAERDFERGMRVNLDATRDLLEACRRAGRCPRFVFTSSIAVYGGALPEPVTDDTPPSPRLSYGAQKLACEVLVNDYTRRGYIDGRSLRLPAVLVRTGAANAAVSGWASAIVREPLAGRAYVCPVRPDTRTACLSIGRTTESLLHAGELPDGALGSERTVLLTGIPVRADELVRALRAAAPGRRLGEVEFRPDPGVQAIIDAVPRATWSRRAAALGFVHDAGVDEIVGEFLRGEAAEAQAAR